MKLLFLDVETSLMKVYTHYIGSKVSIQHTQIAEPSKIICICYKWEGENKVHSLTWDKHTQDDSEMLSAFNEIAREADAVCGHNGKGFDIKKIRGEIALRGLASAWCETPCIDTLLHYRRMFRFASNRLDAVARSLGLGHKGPMGMQDWIDVSNKVPGALDKMVKYCKKDVVLLEQVYHRLKEYVVPAVSENRIYKGVKTSYDFKCSQCEGNSFIKYGIYTYKGADYQKYLCKVCNTVNMPEKPL